MQKFSIWSLLRNAMSYHEGWQKQWRSPEPKREYDVVVIGAGGHGLATAYYLAKVHGVRNIAVVERGCWPLPLPEYYARDAEHLKEYVRLAATDEGFAKYLDQYVHERRAA